MFAHLNLRPFRVVLLAAFVLQLSVAEAPTPAALQPQSFLAGENIPQSNLMFADTQQEPSELGSPGALKPFGLLRYQNKDFLLDFTTRYRPESFYTKNDGLFSGNSMDQSWYAQSTWDFKLRATKADYLRAEGTLRSQARWGVVQVFSTTENTVQIDGIPTGAHYHDLSRLLPNMREGYIDFSVNKALGVNTKQEHSFTIGVFAYELGRGIALGEAYATSQGLLGFFSDNIVDQFAWGALLHGDITADARLHYDFYGSILQNFSGSFSDTTKELYNQRIMPENNSFRGFGSINFLVSTRVLADILRKETDGCSLVAESYILYNHEPEQKIEFPADSSADLGTWGFAFDYSDPRFELGAEIAFNFGKQNIFAWDRNHVVDQVNTATGSVVALYSDVLTAQGDASNQAPFTTANKNVVNASPKNPAYNNEQIGTVNGVSLFNSRTRFTPGYENKFTGMMYVMDWAIYLKPQELRFVGTIAFASGDQNPNADLEHIEESSMNGTYRGFLGLQEVYSGKRVRSVFVIGSQSITRILSSPALNNVQEELPTQFAAKSSGFTNLIYCGGGLSWTPEGSKRNWDIKPNLLFYWQDEQVRRFVLQDGSFITDNAFVDFTDDAAISPSVFGARDKQFARNFLGTEINCFIDFSMLDQLKFYIVSALFFPGDHYRDVFGTPLSVDDLAAVEEAVQTGKLNGSLPLLGKSSAFAFNAGMEYAF